MGADTTMIYGTPFNFTAETSGQIETVLGKHDQASLARLESVVGEFLAIRSNRDKSSRTADRGRPKKDPFPRLATIADELLGWAFYLQKAGIGNISKDDVVGVHHLFMYFDKRVKSLAKLKAQVAEDRARLATAASGKAAASNTETKCFSV